MSFNKERVETKFIEFNPHNDFLKGLKNYIDNLMKTGYSDIAIGAAAILGFKLPINFNEPYKASSLTDF